MRQVTLCLLIKDNEVLLAMKKRGFGEGKWNGVGGKVQDGERIEDAAIREMEEEIGVTAHTDNMDKVGQFRFYFIDNPDWNQEMHVYFIREWDGEPSESDEMLPQWYRHEEIPFDSMWQDDRHWLPRALAGEKLEGDFHFADGGATLEKWDIQRV